MKKDLDKSNPKVVKEHKQELKVKIPLKEILIPNNSTNPWYTYRPASPEGSSNKATQGRKHTISAYRKLAENIIESDKNTHYSENSSLVPKLADQGTLQDKITALQIQVSLNPFHNFHRLENLLHIAQKPHFRTARPALTGLKNLFINELLPDSKLTPFHRQNLAQIDTNSQNARSLAFFLLEEKVSGAYQRYVSILSTLCNSSLPGVRNPCFALCADLLTAKPEREDMLLGILVSGLLSVDKSTAQLCFRLLGKLVEKHSAMQTIIFEEIRSEIRAALVKEKKINIGVEFIGQLVVDEELATKIFEFDKELLLSIFSENEMKNTFSAPKKRKRRRKKMKKTEGTTGPKSQKLFNLILTSISRVLPFCKDVKMDELIDLLFLSTHTMPFNAAVRAFSILIHLMISMKQTSKRLYRSLYEKILSPDFLLYSNKKMFLNLVFKAVIFDTEKTRVKAFLKRLGQAALNTDSLSAAYILLTITEISKLKNEPGDTDGFDLDSSLGVWGTEFGSFVETKFDLLDKREKIDGERDEESSDDEVETEKLNFNFTQKKTTVVETEKEPQNKSEVTNYDPKKKEPLYSGANQTLFHELNLLTQYFHPSIRLFFNGSKLSKHPDEELSNGQFLENMMFAEVRSRENKKKFASEISSQTRNKLNSGSFLNMDPEKVAPHESIYYNYFHAKMDLEGKSIVQLLEKEQEVESRKAVSTFVAADDDEAEKDAFAMKLAENMIKEAAGGVDVDIDEDFGFE
eukprot:augustus_masked-scaffold_3-processed-gene-7.51-mRNA-1 protein AED:1.00 eAED:1.00 QI:0/-1/0/0/-1/1/1/0/745